MTQIHKENGQIYIWFNVDDKFSLPESAENEQILNAVNQLLKKQREQTWDSHERFRQLQEDLVKQAQNETAYLRDLIHSWVSPKPDWSRSDKSFFNNF